MSKESEDKKTEQQINEDFIKECLTDEAFAKADVSTIEVYKDVNFIDPDFHKFVSGVLLSVMIDGEIFYIYMVLKIGKELSETFSNSIIKCAKDSIREWHMKNNPNYEKEPRIKTYVFTCDRKGEIDK